MHLLGFAVTVSLLDEIINVFPLLSVPLTAQVAHVPHLCSCVVLAEWFHTQSGLFLRKV